MRTTSPTRPRPRVNTQLWSYLQMLCGRSSHGFLEVRYRHGDGMARLFAGTHRLDAAARTIATLAERTDVYCGAVLRSRHAGGRDAVTTSALVWVEIDHHDALARLMAFAHPASMIIRSGTAGHAHAYWQLRHPVKIAELEQANRRLAHHLGGDPASTDAARILRPCGTRNHKHTPPTAVTLAAHRPRRRYELAELVAGLDDPPGLPARSAADHCQRVTRGSGDGDLLAIPAADYVRALTGREPRRDGKLSCPFHADHTPSLQTYPDGTFYCFGCGAGGSIYDFAARLWGAETKGRAFLALRQRLRDQLLD